MKNVLITGCSSGIGLATARKFLHHGWRVFGSVRNKNVAQKLTISLGENFYPLIFDVTDFKNADRARAQLTSVVGESGLDCLVNNAGTAVSGPLLHINLNEFRHQFDVNVFGLLKVTQLFTPLLKGNKKIRKNPGRIINISSMSGLIARPFLGPYSASKFALESMTDTLRRELMVYDIKVIAIEPGPIRTPIWKKAVGKHHKYQNTVYGPVMEHFNEEIAEIERSALPVENVAKLIYKTVHSRHPKTRYRIVPKPVFIWLALHVLGDKLQDKLFYKHIAKLAKS